MTEIPATDAVEPFIGEIRMFAGDFAPKGWAFCDGALVAIAQNTALFSLLGTNFGGNGVSNFALPDLRDSVPLHWGQGPGLTLRDIGETGGAASVVLDRGTMAPHTHVPRCDSGSGAEISPAGHIWAASSARDRVYAAPPADIKLAAALADAGGGMAHPNAQPCLAVGYIIALKGLFPSRGDPGEKR